MTRELEQAVNDATDAFLAAILAAAEHAVTTVIRSTFATAMHQILDARAAGAELTARDAPARRGRPVTIYESAARLAAAPGAHRGALTAVRERAPQRTATPELQAALLCRIVACVREHPGATVPQLVPYLMLSAGRLRRLLHRLASDGVIRVERRPSELFGGQQLLTYFAGDRITPTETEPTAAAPTVAAAMTSMDEAA
jgi:hypothetical protein